MENASNYYKIVQTIENGMPALSVVAASWENAGKLMWPNESKIQKALMKNAMIKPGTVEDGWTLFDCQLKRSFITTYTEARKLLLEMSDQSDTDLETINIPLSIDNNALVNKRRTAAARKIVKTITNADADRNNYNQVYEPHGIL